MSSHRTLFKNWHDMVANIKEPSNIPKMPGFPTLVRGYLPSNAYKSFTHLLNCKAAGIIWVEGLSTLGRGRSVRTYDSNRVKGFLRLLRGNATGRFSRCDSNAAAIISTVKRAS